jgi:predicted outer membrane protein
MIRTIVISLATAASVAVVPVARAQGAKPEPRPYTQAFLKKAAEMQQAQIALALLVDGRAANTRVKQFGEEMITAHKKMSQEVQQMQPRKAFSCPRS